MILGLALSPCAIGGIPTWVLTSGGSRATLDIDFVNNQAWLNPSQVSIASLLTCARASEGYYTNAAGVLTSFGNDVLRYGDQGLLVEEERTNVVLHNRDLTNAAWTKSNTTAAKDQTGPDGVANSASSLTATAANATCLQSITLASSARFETAYVKRITGSGTVNMTMDNGTTWTAVTVTASWTRVSIPTQTLANPIVGFRIVTSGDAIAVDLVQNENSGAFATSPIAITSAARAADLVKASAITWLNLAAGTFYANPNWIANSTANPRLFSADNDSTNEFMCVDYTGATTARVNVIDGGVVQADLSHAANSPGTADKVALAYAADSFGFVLNGGTVQTDASGTLPTPTQVSLGSGAGSNFVSLHMRRFAYWNTRLADAAIDALTT